MKKNLRVTRWLCGLLLAWLVALGAHAQPAGCQPSYLDNTGTTSGLTGEYYATNILQTNPPVSVDARIALFNQLPGLRRNDAQLNYPGNTTWGSIVPPATAGPGGDGPDSYSARFRGSIFLTAGTYRFRFVADDAAYLWIGPSALTPTPTVATALIGQANYNNENPSPNAVGASFTATTSGLYDLQLVFRRRQQIKVST